MSREVEESWQHISRTTTSCYKPEHLHYWMGCGEATRGLAGCVRGGGVKVQSPSVIVVKNMVMKDHPRRSVVRNWTRKRRCATHGLHMQRCWHLRPLKPTWVIWKTSDEQWRAMYAHDNQWHMTRGSWSHDEVDPPLQQASTPYRDVHAHELHSFIRDLIRLTHEQRGGTAGNPTRGVAVLRCACWLLLTHVLSLSTPALAILALLTPW